jgi:hypothetical protein
LPHVRFIGAHTGCSCGFPSVIAEEPFEYYEGRSVRSIRSFFFTERFLHVISGALAD